MLNFLSLGRAVGVGSILLLGSASASASALAEGSVRHPPPPPVEQLSAESTPAPSEIGVAAAAAAAESAPDVSALDRDQLVALVEQLARENEQLRQRLGDEGMSGEAGPPDLHATVAAQAIQLEGLRDELAALAERMGQLEADASLVGPPSPPEPPMFAPPPPPPAPEGARGPAAAAPGDAPVAPEEVGEFRYTYEFGLIRTEDSEVVVLRDEEGRQRVVRVDTNEYRDDALKLTLYFKNTSDRPLRYTGLIALGGKRNYNDARPPVLATTTFRTPRLQPGEVLDLSREVDVDRPWRVDVVELGKVKSYPDRP